MTEAQSATKRLLINSLPKSGTHLLAKAVEILGYKEHFEPGEITETPLFFNYGEVKKRLEHQTESDQKISIGALTPCYVDSATFRHWLTLISPKQYILGHIPWTPLLMPILSELNYQQVFIIRDPRAVVVSLIPFVLDTGKMPGRHFLEDDFSLMSPTQRLDFILEGGYAVKAGVEIKNFAEVYRSMLAWRNEENCLFIHFEDLVGEQGGGTKERQEAVVYKICSYLDIPFDDTILSQLSEIYNPGARTFRTGKIDGWKSSMNAEDVEKLNIYCQPLCEEAEYTIG
ncbi:sulfotransferase domain-containing protein [Dolichospermum circinale]|uniref:sulfotransferase domain-containing protein n=1 Tax=Dolichospermum circinale TaxID=109265 RepID=UPI00232DA6E2|nr:sulfotransferase domain-containing protein [Dolichospermum circinale]MDB9450216.1 sulfotransferase domain-containing protein [Dolichospermum circinale CS-547]